MLNDRELNLFVETVKDYNLKIEKMKFNTSFNRYFDNLLISEQDDMPIIVRSLRDKPAIKVIEETNYIFSELNKTINFYMFTPTQEIFVAKCLNDLKELIDNNNNRNKMFKCLVDDSENYEKLHWTSHFKIEQDDGKYFNFSFLFGIDFDNQDCMKAQQIYYREENVEIKKLIKQ